MATHKMKREWIQQYLRDIEGDYPNYEDFIIWAVTKKKRITLDTDLRDYRVYINIYSKQWLNKKIASGGRHTQNLLPLLRELQAQEQLTKIEEQQDYQPVQVVFDFKEPKNKGDYEKVKLITEDSKEL